MICSATRSFRFWRMKASSRCGTSFQRVVSATLLRICVASNLQRSSHPFRWAALYVSATKAELQQPPYHAGCRPCMHGCMSFPCTVPASPLRICVVSGSCLEMTSNLMVCIESHAAH